MRFIPSNTLLGRRMNITQEVTAQSLFTKYVSPEEARKLDEQRRNQEAWNRVIEEQKKQKLRVKLARSTRG